METIATLKKHIKKCNKRGTKYDFLGFVENKDLSPELENCFTLCGVGMFGYDWVNGNSRLKNIIAEVL